MKENSDYMNHILAKHFAYEPLSSEEESALVEWMMTHKEEYAQLSQVMDAKPYNRETAWNRVKPRLKEQRPISRLFTLRKVLAYAACLVILVGVTHYVLQQNTDDRRVYTNSGIAEMKVTLPDSSSVVLFPNSSIRYLADANNRRVEMEGKAFYKVRRKHGQRFSVKSGEVEVSVLGTSFLVASPRPGETEVSVREGHVRVTSADEQVELGANEQVRLRHHQLVKDSIHDTEEVFQTLIPEKTYVDVPLQQVLQEIEKEFNIKIHGDETLLNSRISSTLKLTQVDEILNEISYICNCNYRKISEKKYELFTP